MNTRHLMLPLLFTASCYPATGAAPGPVAAPAAEAASSRWPDTTPDSLERGRQLLLANCNRCHGYPDLEKIDDSRWPAIVKRMGHKAHLPDADQELVLRFILVERSGGTSGGP